MRQVFEFLLADLRVGEDQLDHFRIRQRDLHAQRVARLGELLLGIHRLQIGRPLLRGQDHRLCALPGRGLAIPGQGKEFLPLQLALQQLVSVPFGILQPIRVSRQGNPQRRAFAEALRQGFEFFLLGRLQRNGPGGEGDEAQIAVSGKERGEERKGGGGRLDEKVFQDLEDNPPDVELRIVYTSRYRDVEMDFPPVVFQQRESQLDREARRLVAFHLVSERELIDPDLVLRYEFLVFDVVGQIEKELSLFQDVSQIGFGVRAHRR